MPDAIPLLDRDLRRGMSTIAAFLVEKSCEVPALSDFSSD